MKRKLLSILLCILLLPVLSVHAEPASRTFTVAEIEDLCGGIAAYKESACGASSVQEWIDTGLCADAGTTAEFYAITLSRSGSYDFSRYEASLLNYLHTNEVYSATTREKYALALIACGSSDSYIQRVCDSDIGGLGLMSLVFGLHLLNNGCTSSLYTVDSLIDAILGYQLADGGWAVIGSSGDADVTAMVIQSIAPYYGSDADVTAAVDSALELLSRRQLNSGGYISMGNENCESAAQVLMALSELGIDQGTDARFIKDGHTVLDAMLAYRNADGSFAHTGSGFNENATIQAFYSLRAYLRMRRGQSAFYLLDRHSQSVPQTVETSPAAVHSDPEDDDADTQSSVITDDASDETAVVPSEKASVFPTEPPHGDYIAPTGDAVFQPIGAGNNLATADETPSSSGGYKLYAVLAVLLAAAITCVILFIIKKRGFKNYIAVVLLTAAAIALILLTNFESKESYAQVGEKTNPSGTVTMTISCTVINGEDDRLTTIPDDGVILPETTFTIGEGETVYDVLLEASKRYDVRIDNRGGTTSAYIAGIQYLYEFDYGELSGWMYRVNGVFPEVGCQGYYLSDGDRIEWLYTKEIGKDLVDSR